MELQGKKVIVAGSGVSGIGAVTLLGRLGAKIILYDGNKALTKEEIRQNAYLHFHISVLIY